MELAHSLPKRLFYFEKLPKAPNLESTELYVLAHMSAPRLDLGHFWQF